MTGICRTALLAQPIRVTPDGVEAYRVELPPGQPVGVHAHPDPSTGSAERGRIAFERDGQPVRELRPGDVFFEPVGEIIRRFDNLPGSEAATFAAVCLPSGDQPLVQLIQ
jgi:quercetin dioxygenase-like cupin family protein